MKETLDQIIDDAFTLYCPQVRSEITDLSKFLLKHFEYPPENILEIGTKYGGTFYIWNSLWKETCLENDVVAKKPTCISIDMSDGGQHGGISEEDMNKRDLWFLERFDNCHFIRGDSHNAATLTKMLRILYNNHEITKPIPDLFEPKLDFLFIDGDHSYGGVKQDFLDYSPFVKRGGIIVFHDIVISDRHHERDVYVGEFWRHLTKFRLFDGRNPEKNICMIDGNHYEFHEFIGSFDQDWAGIGILIKL